MTDIFQIIGYFWILPTFLIIILNIFYRKALVKKIFSGETQTNKSENFKLTREYDKISFCIGTDSDLGNQEGYQIYINNQDMNKYITSFYPSTSLFILEIPAKKLLTNNILKIKHQNNLTLGLTITGEVKKVRQTLIYILLSIIIISAVISLYYFSPLL